MMRIQREHDGEVVVLTPIPQTDQGLGEGDIMGLRDELKALAADGSKRLAIDLRHVELLGSLEIGVLVGAARSLQQQNGIVVLCGLKPNIADTLKIVKVWDILPVRITREQAIRELGSVKIKRNTLVKMINDNPEVDQIREWWIQDEGTIS